MSRLLRCTPFVLFASGLVFSLCYAAPTNAALVVSNLGNTASGLVDGTTYSLVPDILNAQSGQPAPFDQGYGLELDPIGSDFAQNWTHSFGGIADSILSANITIGIFDHDSAASGSQLSIFDLDGNDLTSTLDGLFETPGNGDDGEYNVYTVAIPLSALPSLTDGSLTVQLDLAGPALVTPLFPLPGPNPPVEVGFNGAHVIFSSLEITTEDTQPPGAIPEPGTMAIWSFLAGVGLLGRARLRKKRLSPQSV